MGVGASFPVRLSPRDECFSLSRFISIYFLPNFMRGGGGKGAGPVQVSFLWQQVHRPRVEKASAGGPRRSHVVRRPVEKENPTGNAAMSSSSTLLLLHLVLVLGLAAPPARTHPLDADVSHVSDIAADASHDSDVAHDVDPVEGSAEEEAVHHHHAHHPEPEATPMFPFFGSYVYQRLQGELVGIA